MNAIRIYDPNNGNYKKGMTPWNKGSHNGRVNCSEKGKCGFVSREVVALNEDGKIIRRFPSVENARSTLGMKDRHAIIRACQQKSLCRGLRLMYADDYIPWADYHYKRSKDRDIYGRLQKGHHANIRMRKPSSSALANKKKLAKERSIRQSADPNCKYGKGGKLIPCYCVNTKDTFASRKAAAQHFGFKASLISWAITNHKKCHGLTFKNIKNE